MYGLVLEGGGAKGAFHLGAVKALLESNYSFQGVTGTSIGAINGAAIAQGDFEKLWDVWENLDPTQLFDIEAEEYAMLSSMERSREALFTLLSGFRKVIRNRGVNTEKIRQMIGTLLQEDKLRNSGIDFGLVTVALPQMRPVEIFKEEIPQGMIKDYLLFSASFPGFQLASAGDSYYIDGGFYDNCPINLIAKKGYTELVVLRTQSMGVTRKPTAKDLNILEITPSAYLGGILNFDNALIRRNMQVGYFDALRPIYSLQGKKYYIKPQSDKEILYALLQIKEDLLRELGVLWNMPEGDPRRILLEKILPSIAAFLELKKSSSYSAILIRLFELAAEKSGLDRLQIYSFSHWVEAICALGLPPLAEGPRFVVPSLTTANPAKLYETARRLLYALGGR